MKVKFLKAHFVNGKPIAAGSIVNIPDGGWETFVANGKAEKVAEEKATKRAPAEKVTVPEVK